MGRSHFPSETVQSAATAQLVGFRSIGALHRGIPIDRDVLTAPIEGVLPVSKRTFGTGRALPTTGDPPRPAALVTRFWALGAGPSCLRPTGGVHMGDSSQGPGWWIASDGKWYPPDSHPNQGGLTFPERPDHPLPVGTQPGPVARTAVAVQKSALTAWEGIWYVLMCIPLGAGYLAKIPSKRALQDFGMVEMTGAERFWYVLMCVFFGAGYFAKIPTAKALSELPQYKSQPSSTSWLGPV